MDQLKNMFDTWLLDTYKNLPHVNAFMFIDSLFNIFFKYSLQFSIALE